MESRLPPRARRRPWERWLAYADALESVETGWSFYRLPFVADRTGVARELLALRDEMRMAGWNGEPVAGATILTALAGAERDRPAFEGLPDRIDRILPHLATLAEPRLPAEILVADLPREPLADRFVAALGARGVRIEPVEWRETVRAKPDLTVLRLALEALFEGNDPRELLALPKGPLPRGLAERLPVGGDRWREGVRELRRRDELARGRVALWIEGAKWELAPKRAVIEAAERVGEWARETGQVSLAWAAGEVAGYAEVFGKFSRGDIARMLRDVGDERIEPSLISPLERKRLASLVRRGCLHLAQPRVSNGYAHSR